MGTKTIEDEIKDLIYRFSTNSNLKCDVKDLTHLKTYTIDDSKTVEIDDAISLEQVSGQNKLWIHIASPASYIEYQSGIDEKARKLVSTVYLSSNTYYMLPEALINNVFSLSDKAVSYTHLTLPTIYSV